MSDPNNPLHRKLIVPVEERAPFNRRCYDFGREAAEEIARFLARTLWLPLSLCCLFVTWGVTTGRVEGVAWIDAYRMSSELAWLVCPPWLALRCVIATIRHFGH